MCSGVMFIWLTKKPSQLGPLATNAHATAGSTEHLPEYLVHQAPGPAQAMNSTSGLLLSCLDVIVIRCCSRCGSSVLKVICVGWLLRRHLVWCLKVLTVVLLTGALQGRVQSRSMQSGGTEHTHRSGQQQMYKAFPSQGTLTGSCSILSLRYSVAGKRLHLI